MPKSIVFVARYNEDISWVESLDQDVVVYNKGDDFPYDFPCNQTENIGRESETFVRGIIEYYDMLKEYEYVCFLQGNPFEHCKDVIEWLEDYPENYLPLCDTTTKHHLDFISFIGKYPLITVGKIFNLSTSFRLDDKSEYDCMDEINNAISLCAFLDIPLTETYDVLWANGAQYSVNTKFILNKSLDWWCMFIDLIHYSWATGDTKLGYTIEQIWPMIWNYSDGV